MSHRRSTGWMIFVAAIVCAGCSKSRKDMAFDTVDELHTTWIEVVNILKAVQDAPTANEAIPKLKEKLPPAFTLHRDIHYRIKEANRAGGISKSEADDFKERLQLLWPVWDDFESEKKRLQKTHGLPIEFWNVFRAETCKGSAIFVPLFPQLFSQWLIDYRKATAEIMQQYGPERVVEISLPHTASMQMDEIVRELQAKLGRGVKSAHLDDRDGSSIMIGPIDDFDKFVELIDFGRVTEKDPAQRSILVDTRFSPRDEAKAKQATEAMQPHPSALAGGAVRQNPTYSPGVGTPLTRPTVVPGGFPGPSPLQTGTSRPELPKPSDPEYYKKLADLMVGPGRTLKAQAIDALLAVKPEDISEKAVRQQVARNFRELASGDDARIKGKATRGLVLYGGKFSVPILIEILEKHESKAPQELFDGLAQYPAPEGAEALLKQLDSRFNRVAAYRTLLKMGPVAEDAVRKTAIKNADPSLEVISLLAEVGTQKSMPILSRAAKSKDAAVSDAAKTAIRTIRDRLRKAAKEKDM
jgi:hypothetical protein